MHVTECFTTNTTTCMECKRTRPLPLSEGQWHSGPSKCSPWLTHPLFPLCCIWTGHGCTRLHVDTRVRNRGAISLVRVLTNHNWDTVLLRWISVKCLSAESSHLPLNVCTTPYRTNSSISVAPKPLTSVSATPILTGLPTLTAGRC